MKNFCPRIYEDNPELSAGTRKTCAFSQIYPAIVGVATINELVEYAANSCGMFDCAYSKIRVFGIMT